MAGRERLELDAAGVLSPFGQRDVLVAAPAGAWVVVPDVVADAEGVSQGAHFLLAV